MSTTTGTRAPSLRPQGPDAGVAYHGRPILKPPVWTWQIPAYFFVGGLAGMASAIALAGLVLTADPGMVRTAVWVAGIAALVNPLLLTADLGRPRRFLAMLRVLKLRSPMSVGAWVIAAYGGVAALTVGLFEWHRATASTVAFGLLLAALAIATILGATVSVYTGVLLGATAIPAWSTRRVLLPVHFGIAALGSAAAILEVLGFRATPLDGLGFFVASIETVVGATVELRRRRLASRAMREGRSGAMLRGGGVLAGPAALVLRILGLRFFAALAFLLGALLSRYAWLDVGRSSARDPEALLELQRSRTAE